MNILKAAKTIKAVVFDGDGTVFDIRGSIGEHYFKFFRQHNIQCSSDEIDEIIPSAWKEFQMDYIDRQSNYQTNCAREEKLWKSFVKKIASHFSESEISEELLHQVYMQFSKAESRTINQDILDTLKHLHSNDYTIALLTNNDLRTHVLVEDLKLKGYFDFIFCACELGIKKPAKECYELVSKHLEVAPQSLLYIGDHYEQDYTAAKAAGWHAYHYRPQESSVLDDVIQLLEQA